MKVQMKMLILYDSQNLVKIHIFTDCYNTKIHEKIAEQKKKEQCRKYKS